LGHNVSEYTTPFFHKKENTVKSATLSQNLIEMQKHTAPIASPPQSIVILARECYGDAIMQTPLIATLRQTYPASAIYVVAFTRIICDFFSADSNAPLPLCETHNPQRRSYT